MKSNYVHIVNDANQAARYIVAGRIVAMPTGTSYGLAVDALQGWALQRLRHLKERPEEKSFTVCMKDELIDKYLELSGEENDFLVRHRDQPVTLLVKPLAALSHLAQNGRVGLRVIDHILMKELAEAVDVPLTATSANKAGGEPCFSLDCILNTFPSVVEEGTSYNLSLAAILDAGELPPQKPSTIVRIEDTKINIVREGAANLDL